MQVKRFESEPAGPGDKPQEARAEDDGPAPVRASPPRETEERRSEDALEEPGYGHGV